MKKKEFKKAIQEEIIDILEAVTADDVENQKSYNDELAKTAQLSKDAGLSESLNPEVSKKVDQFIKAMAKRYGYEEQDAVYAIMAALEQRKSNKKYDMPGFEGTMDALDGISIRTEANDSDKSQDDGYVNHTYDDQTIDKYNIPVEPTAVFEDEKNWADYQDIGQFYLDGFNRKHSLTGDELEVLGKKIVSQLYKGDIGKAYDAIVNRDKLDIPGKPKFVKEEEDEDKEPTASQLKKEPISKIGYKLADTQKEMKKVVKKWKDAEGDEKVKLTDRLRELTKIKKELESLLESKN